MVEEEIKILKVQQRPKGNFMVTIPKEISDRMRLRKGKKVKVLLDEKKKKIIYQL